MKQRLSAPALSASAPPGNCGIDTPRDLARPLILRRVRWQNLKFKLGIGAACLVVLIIILAASGAFSGSSDGPEKSEGGKREEHGRRLLFMLSVPPS